MLVVLILGVFIFLTLSALTMNSFLFQRTRSQDKTDALALALASKINIGDRVGQMNELQAHSRELIFLSRQRTKDCNEQELEFLAPLCDQLLNEARIGHELVERERRNQIQQICKELRDTAHAHNNLAEQSGLFKLGWLLTEEPVILRVDLGRIANVESNVKAGSAVSDLFSWDLQRKFFTSASKLYRAEIDARLPEPDADLGFKISTLPANINNTCSPSRNVNPGVFLSRGTIFDSGENTQCNFEFIPTAVQIHCAMKTTIGSQKEYQGEILLVSSAAGNGAMNSAQ